MSTTTEFPSLIPLTWSIADLLDHFGDIPPERIRLHPAPGTATLADAARLETHEYRLCELINGTLVEKRKGYLESEIAGLMHVLFPGTGFPSRVRRVNPSNRPSEMNRKLNDYFSAGVELVWYLDPASRTARVYTSCEEVAVIPADGVLSGNNLLPGLEISLAELFAEAEKIGPQG